MKGGNGVWLTVGISDIQNYTEFWECYGIHGTNSFTERVQHGLQSMVDNGIFVTYQLVDFYDTGEYWELYEDEEGVSVLLILSLEERRI
jgi:hypothetical protein